jgi:DNA-binding MarR family transcriptional regulator
METTHGELSSHLRLTVMRLARRLRQEGAGEVTATHLSALSTLAKHGEMSLGELAAIERIEPPSMTRIAARLELDGLALRQQDPKDRRVSRIAVTPFGLQVLDETRTRRDAFLAAKLQRLGDEDRETLTLVLPLLERIANQDDMPGEDDALLELEAAATPARPG